MAEESQNDTPLDEVHASPPAELELVNLSELIDLSTDAQIIEGTVLITTSSFLPDVNKGNNSIPLDSDLPLKPDEEHS